MAKIITIIQLFILAAIISCSSGSPGVSVGQEGHIDSGGEFAIVGLTEKALDEWNSARAAKDADGLVEVLKIGRVFDVKSGTKVLVIDMSPGKRKIRILEGNKAKLAGWVLMEHVKE